MRHCNSEVLFHGQPGEVYRKCGKPNCKCVAGGDSRHGPYSIIRVFRDGKNTQITVKSEELELLKMAERYQSELGNRREIREVLEEIQEIIEELMERRTLRSKAEYRKREQ